MEKKQHIRGPEAGRRVAHANWPERSWTEES